MLFTHILIIAQPKSFTISGKLIDKESKEPLAFASVAVKGEPFGVVSNTVGEFDFHLSTKFENSILSISMLGYEGYEVSINQLDLSNTLIIPMTKSVQVLEEVVIADSLNGGDITEIALNKIEYNYPMHPFLIDGFYRDLKKVNGKYISLLEAAIRAYDKGYEVPRDKEKLREKVDILELRKLGYNNSYVDYFDQGNLLEKMLLQNPVRYRNIDRGEYFLQGLQRKGITTYKNRKVFFVTYEKEFLLKLYIDIYSYAILRIEYDFSPNQQNSSVENRKDFYSKVVRLSKTIDFKEYKGVMYLNYMTLHTRKIWFDNNNQVKYDTELVQELIINNVKPKPKNRIRPTNRMKKYALRYHPNEYNKEFWQNYNVLKASPLDKKIVRDLERETSLDEQFENN